MTRGEIGDQLIIDYIFTGEEDRKDNSKMSGFI